ncbi:hypothetical protein HanIR_Chr17g0885011 [Helianthus annuus]|nr:hypothetical protein HanIR_Chr17g0885011 [Helianthus annuus]
MRDDSVVQLIESATVTTVKARTSGERQDLNNGHWPGPTESPVRSPVTGLTSRPHHKIM